MFWKKFDKKMLTPYEKTGSPAKKFASDVTVFSYTALRHVAYHAFNAGMASNKGNSPDQNSRCVCPKCGGAHDFKSSGESGSGSGR